MSSCWFPACDREYTRIYWYDRCSNCQIFEPGSNNCSLCRMATGPSAPRCANWAWGCKSPCRLVHEAELSMAGHTPLAGHESSGARVLRGARRPGLCCGSARGTAPPRKGAERVAELDACAEAAKKLLRAARLVGGRVRMRHD